jgi:hypothetical protein
MRAALVPLDDRPVNTDMVRDIADIASATVALPPRELLPDFRTPGDPEGLGTWLLDACAGGLDAAVVSLDMLGHGGLITSRTSADPLREVLRRIAVLERLHEERPEVRLGALNVFLRASDSNSAVEEPEYWTDHGRRLHALGARAHAAWVEQLGQGPATVTAEALPAAVRRDFALRRLRNHAVNLAGLELLHSGTVQALLLTADDTAPFSAGSAEQLWVDYWRTLLGPHDDLLVYPGADEVAAVMTARMLSLHHRSTVSFEVRCVEAEGLGRVAPFENVPIGTTVTRQVAAAGGRLTTGEADVVLVVHAPSPEREDHVEGRPARTDPALVAATVEAVAAALAEGRQVALADCRWPNGGDPTLVEALRDAGLLLQLLAYGGWNTAGNTIGSVVAAAAAAVLGQRTGTLRPEAQQRFLLHRIVEDYGYQSVSRTELLSRGYGYGDLTLHGPRGDAEAALVRERLDGILCEVLGADAGTWRVSSVGFPWRRTFEIALRLDPVAAGVTPPVA